MSGKKIGTIGDVECHDGVYDDDVGVRKLLMIETRGKMTASIPTYVFSLA